MLWFMGSQRVKHDLATQLNLITSECIAHIIYFFLIQYWNAYVTRNLCIFPKLSKSLTSKHLSVQFSSVAQSCPTLCDPMNRSTPGLPVHHQLPEFTQTHVHRVCDTIQPSHPLSSPSPPAPIPPSIRVFPNESALRMRRPRY